MIVWVKVKPRAKRAGVKRVDEGHFEVAVNEAPEKGRANEAVLEALAEFLKVPKSRLSIKSGPASRNKRIEIK